MLMRRLPVLAVVLLACTVAAPAARAYYSGVPTPGNALAGHPWFVDSAYGVWWEEFRQAKIAAAALLTAAWNPMNKTFGAFEPHPEIGLRSYLKRAATEQPGAIPFISLSRIEHQSCPYAPPGWGRKGRGRSRFYHAGCTPPGEGLGYRPTVATADPHIDAYLWLGTPGFESGPCLGLRSGYHFYLQEAVSLVQNANPPFAVAARNRPRASASART